MKILGRPRTWFTLAAVWAAIVDILVIAHHHSGSALFWGAWLAIPVLVTLVALLMQRVLIAWVAVVVYLLIAVLSFPAGLYLGPGMLAVVLGSLLIGAAPPGE